MRKQTSTAKGVPTRRMLQRPTRMQGFYKKGKEAKLCFMGHGLMENHYGLLIDACLTEA